MEKLWSPWRSNYIESFKDKTGDEKCIFCHAVHEDIESDDCLVVHKGEKCFIVLNLYPYNGGHLMIVPNRHLSEFNKLETEEMTEIMSLSQITITTLNNIMKPQGYNFGANIGKAAGAGIDQHLHFHILPRWVGDTNFMPALGEVKIISQDLLNLKKTIREELLKHL